MEWVGLEGTLKVSWFQPHCHGQEHQTSCSVASNLAWNTAREVEGRITASCSLSAWRWNGCHNL